MKKTIFVLVLCAFLVPLKAFAAEPIGTILFTEGICDIAREGAEPVAIQPSQPVYLNDRIRTKSYSKASIELADKSVLKLAPNSSLTVQEFSVTEKDRREFARVLLTRGKLEAVVSKTGAPDTFAIDTPNAKGSVKGTDVFVSYLAGSTGVFVQEGAISVFNPALATEKAHVTKGDCVFVPLEGAPGEVRQALDLELAGHKKDVEGSLVKKWVPSEGSAKMTAQVVSTAGDARLFRSKAEDWAELKQKDMLLEGDKIQTGDDGRVEIRLGNGNSIFIDAGSELEIKSMRIDPETGDFDNVFHMPKGKLNGIVEKINKRSSFRVETPTAIASVRGTYIQVIAALPTPQAPAVETQVFFEGGHGEVFSPLSNETQQVGSGEHLTADLGGNLSAPMATSPQQRVEMAQSWQMAQNVDQYNAPQAASGLNSQSPNAPPPPPPGPGLAPPPPNPQMENMAVLSTLTFNQVSGPPLPQQVPDVFYTSNLSKFTGTPAQIVTSNINLGLDTTGRWGGQINGTFSAAITSTPWNLNLKNVTSGDELHFIVSSQLLMNTTNGTFNLALDPSFDDITGPPIDKSLNLDSGIVGHYVSGASSGNFNATVGGTWHDG